MGDWAHTIPVLPSNLGASIPSAVIRCATHFSRTQFALPPRVHCSHSQGPRQCASACSRREVRGRKAALPGSPACHICTYLKLGWWSVLSGMPIAGLASYDICID